ncbi:MAG: PHP domain-containing protein [Lachnospiraceae bacterium]|nr:PHP domain-containing protein [Lachnospiraceae bacterium]
MGFIDLHIHTTASDGTFTPTEVVYEALRRKLSVIAITDHDTMKGIEEAVNALYRYGDNNEGIVIGRDAHNCVYGISNNEDVLTIVPGVEVSCQYGGGEIHMLGLFIDDKNDVLEMNLTEMRKERDRRNEKMIALFNEKNIPMTMDDLLFGQADTVVTRAHFARYLVENGYVKTKDEAFKKYIGDGCPFYLPRHYIEPETAIRWIHEAGGLAFLAHPYLYGFKEEKVRKMLLDLKEIGLDGLEAYHSSTDNGRTNQLREYANHMELLVSGGSDFHGDNKPYIYMGVGKGNLRITDHVYEQICKSQV